METNRMETNRIPGTIEVQSFIDGERFSPYQWIILVLCFLVVAADGFDTAAIGFIAPSLIGDWGITRAALGPVMSAALVGLGIGALVAGPAADRIGRKAVLALSVFFFGVWSLASAQAGSVESLTAWRFLTGLGLGAAMPNAVTLMSEYAPSRIRAIAVNTMFCGFSVGLSIGGLCAAWLIPHFGWQSVLVAGGVGPIVLTVMLLLLLPESAQFMVVRKRPAEKIARVLRRISNDPRLAPGASVSFAAADTRTSGADKSSLGLIVSRPFRFGTLMLWLAYFMGLMIFYLLTNWLPTLFKDAGLLRRTRRAHDFAVSARRHSRQPVSRLDHGPRKPAARERMRLCARRGARAHHRARRVGSALARGAHLPHGHGGDERGHVDVGARGIVLSDEEPCDGRRMDARHRAHGRGRGRHDRRPSDEHGSAVRRGIHVARGARLHRGIRAGCVEQAGRIGRIA
jgi:benzoate transport